MSGPEPYRILVAEDDEAFLDVVEALLTAYGSFEVVGRAANGRGSGRARVGVLDIDAVVMDVEMPVLDGSRGNAPPARAVAGPYRSSRSSGHDYAERVLEIRAAGADDYVRKARLEDELIDALRRAPARASAAEPY